MSSDLTYEDVYQLMRKRDNKLSHELRVIYFNNIQRISRGIRSGYVYFLRESYFRSMMLDFIKLYTKNGVVDLEAKLNPNERLISAVIKGDVKSAKSLLKKAGAKLNSPEGTYNSLIKWVMWRHDVDTRKDMLLLLLENGLDVELRDESGRNLFHILCRLSDEDDSNAVEVARILINYGLSPSNTDDLEEQPLLSAICIKNVSLISILIDNGADVNETDAIGKFPLWYVVIQKNVDLLTLLLSKGADVNAKCTFDRESALHVACYKNYEKIIRCLILNGADISAECRDGKTPFCYLEKYHEKQYYDECVITMVKEFSIRSFSNVLINKIDVNRMQMVPNAQNHYENCLVELDKMAITKFYGNHTYYSVFKMSKEIKKLAHLTMNKKFVKKFKKNLSGFLYFEKDLLRVLNEAKRVRDELNAVHRRLKSVLRDIFPDIVLRKLRNFLSVKDLPRN